MNHRPNPRRQDYYGSSSRNNMRNRSMGSRPVSNWDVGEEENVSIHSYESVNKPLSYRSSNGFDRSSSDGGHQTDSRWPVQQENRGYRIISPSSDYGHQRRSSSQLDGIPSYYGHVRRFENRDRHGWIPSRVSEEYNDVDQDPFTKQYYSPRLQEFGSIRIRERPVFDRRAVWASNGDFVADGLRNKKPKKLLSPIAGAAAIVSCSNCSILVVLPRRLRIIDNSNHEIRCGSCSAVMLIEVEGTRMRVSTMVKEECSSVVFHHVEPIDESAAESIDDPTEAIKLKCKALIASAVGFSSHEEIINFPPVNVVADESQTLNPKLSNEISTAMSELEVSHVEYPVTKSSQDSEEVNKEDDHDLQPKDRTQPFFVEINEGETTEEKPRSVRNEILEDQRPKVFVNGHQISDFAVKNAEIMAGPILPGNYWYDYTAGFWGVMNYPCLGIIPPFIEEFNYMMSPRCGAGNTGVFVNGRELHQRDLDLLASRGLPTTMYKSYTVHISGKVLDERTGEELYEYDLGKLAPSVENAKRGYGMRVPNGVS